MGFTRCFSFRSSCGLFFGGVRSVTTGDHHHYEPGRITIAFRRLFLSLTSLRLRKSLADKLETRMNQVERYEKEHMWMETYGSPLQLMGLPDHATYAEVKTRYRDLVFETHPDTRKDNLTVGSSELALVSATDYEILQTAYRMVLDPESLFHQNNSAPVLLKEIDALVPGSRTGKVARVHQRTKITLFALLSYFIGGIAVTIIITVVFRQAWEKLFQLFDPHMHSFMVTREQQDQELLEEGAYVEKNPKEHAPLIIKKLLFPGRYIHTKTIKRESEE